MTRQQAERLASEMKKHHGEWVLIKDSRIVAHAATVREAKSSLDAEDRAHVTAFFCPSKDFRDTTFTAL